MGLQLDSESQRFASKIFLLSLHLWPRYNLSVLQVELSPNSIVHVCVTLLHVLCPQCNPVRERVNAQYISEMPKLLGAT